MGKRSPIPSVDEVLRGVSGRAAVERFGHAAAADAVRAAIDSQRSALRAGDPATATRPDVARDVGRSARAALEAAAVPNLRRVFNLTGTILHTNLGRAVLAEAAVAAAADAMRHPAALEYDLETGARGERDDAVRGLLAELTGAEDACVVNNNAAAVLLVLNTLALGRESVVSRGELIEIGGSFRMPEIMRQAGTRLREVGTTNRTHARDYEGAIGPETGLLLKVHTSNYRIDGFTAEVPAAALAAIGRARGVPVVDDLGSGTLVDLAPYGLPRERTVREAVADGADLVTFSGDKLLGGPQAGFIVGRRDLVRQCARNPIKRAVRLDKIRLAALEATLRLYRRPDRLALDLPTLRSVTRPVTELEAAAMRLRPSHAAAVGDAFAVTVAASRGQIGSGALPVETIESRALAIAPRDNHHAGRRLAALARAFRALPIPVIGRIEGGALLLDLRCREDEPGFLAQLAALRPPGPEAATP